MERPDAAGRIAFFGGSFDPPHLGHLAVARAARRALNLDRVLFAPVGAQPLKPLGSTAPFEDRVAMTRLAIAEEPGFELSLVDAPALSGRPNYTIDTLLSLCASLPSRGILFCLMGADSFLSLRQWHRAREIPLVAPLIVASRPGERLADLAAALPVGLTIEDDMEADCPGAAGEVRCFSLRDLDGRSAPFYLLPGLDIEISATGIREQIKESGRGDVEKTDAVPARVVDYIRRHGLYL